MRSLLETDRRPSLSEPTPQQRPSRRMRWIVGISVGALFAAALGYLIVDQVQTRDQFGRAQMSLGVTRQETHTVSVELSDVRRDLSLLKTEVGSQSTALSQDASQLLGL